VDRPPPSLSKRCHHRWRDQNRSQKPPSSIATKDYTVPTCTRRHNRCFMAPTQDGHSEKAARARFYESPLEIPRRSINLTS